TVETPRFSKTACLTSRGRVSAAGDREGHGGSVKRSALLALMALAVVMAGCAEAYLPSGPDGSALTALTVTPSGAAIAGATQQQFSAKTGDGSRPSVNWSVNDVAGGNAMLGTIDSKGMYSAPEFPPTPNGIKVSAVESSNPRMLGNGAATLNNPTPVLTSLTPLEVPQGPFTVTVTGKHFAQGATVYLGTLALATTYVSSTPLPAAGAAAQAPAGTQVITVQNPAPGPSPSTGLNFIIEGGAKVTIAPPVASIRCGSQQTFVATVTGALNTSVTWTVNGVAGGNPPVGTITTAGVYTAPLTLPSPDTVTVTATSVEDPTKSANVTVTVENPIPVITGVTPAILTANMQFLITINGTGFLPTSTVKLAGTPLATTYIAPTQLLATGTPTLAQVGNAVPVTVVNPDPGGATSAPFNVQVVGPNSNITVTIA